MRYDAPETPGSNLILAGRAHRARVGAGLQALGLHVGQEHLLKMLEQQDGLSQSELANRLKVEPPTVTKMLNRMERTGLIERHRDSTDAQVFRVCLGERGRPLLPMIDRVWAAIGTAMLDGIMPEEKRLLVRLLTHLRSNLDGVA